MSERSTPRCKSVDHLPHSVELLGVEGDKHIGDFPDGLWVRHVRRTGKKMLHRRSKHTCYGDGINGGRELHVGTHLVEALLLDAGLQGKLLVGGNACVPHRLVYALPECGGIFGIHGNSFARLWEKPNKKRIKTLDLLDKSYANRGMTLEKSYITLYVRMTHEDRERLKELVREKGMTLSGYLGLLLKRELAASREEKT